MKKLKNVLTAILLVTSTWLAKSQSCSTGTCNVVTCELICNGSFEFYSAPTPSAISQISLACGWVNADITSTPDYFRTNASSTVVGIPCNQDGKEPERSGQNAYAGILAKKTGDQYWREKISTKLKNSLQVNVPYEVTFWLSLGEGSSNNFDGVFGFQFCPAPNYYPSTSLSIVTTSNITQDGWTKITYTHTPSAADNWPQDYLVIGAFPTATSTLVSYSGSTSSVSCSYTYSPSSDVYYYIDDITVKEIIPLQATASNTTGCAGESFSLSASGADSYTWLPGSPTGSLSCYNCQNPISTYSLTTPIIYTVTGTSTAGCVVSNATIAVSPTACCTNTASGNINLRNAKLVPYNTPSSTPWVSLTTGSFYTGNIAVPAPSTVTGISTITKTLTVIGSLTIAAAVNLYTCDIAIGEDAPIYQYSVTNINNSYLRGCDKLWEGIKTYTNLSITNSWIEDAYLAVDIGDIFSLSTHPNFYCDNVLFSKNYIGIGLGMVSMNPDNFRVTGSIFSCRRFGPANYTSATRYTTLFNNVSAKLPQKLLGSAAHGITANTIRSNIGIEMGGPTSNTPTPYYFTIGAANGSTATPTNSDLANLFDYVNEGIYNYHTKLSVINNRFSNIKTESGIIGTSLGAIYHDGQYGETLTKTDVGKFSAGSPSTSDYKNVFGYGTSTILDGITAVRGGSLTVNYNDFIGISRYGVNVKTWTATTPSVEPVMVANNSFTDAAYVFYGYNNQGVEATVQTNTLVHVQGTYNGYYNVYLDELSKPANSKYHIYGNTFTGSLFGAYVRNTSGAKIISNDITVKKPATTSIFNAPVWIEDCQLITVAQNSIDCSPTNSGSWNTFGVFASATPSLTVKCNDIVKTSACLKFQSNCNPTTIYKNNLNNTAGADPCSYGVWLDNIAKTGDIGYFDGYVWRMSDDVWGDFSIADTKCQVNSNTVTPAYKIYYDNSNSVGRPLSLYQPQVNINTSGTGDLSQSYIPTTNTNSNSAQCNEGARMMNLNATNTHTNPVKNGTSQTLIPNPGKLIILDNSGASNRSITNDYNFSVVDSLIESYKSSKNLSILNAARNTNNSINTVDDIEENQKEFYSIYCNFLEDVNLVSASQIQDLKNMALLCPFTDGLAVYQSRGLIRNWDDSTHYYNTCENSTPDLVEENARVAKQKAALLIQDLTEVYPNPSTGMLVVNSNCKNCTFEVYDIIGKKVLSQKLNENETKVDLNTLNSGTYLYKIVQDGATLKADKLILNK